MILEDMEAFQSEARPFPFDYTFFVNLNKYISQSIITQSIFQEWQ